MRAEIREVKKEGLAVLTVMALEARRPDEAMLSTPLLTVVTPV